MYTHSRKLCGDRVSYVFSFPPFLFYAITLSSEYTHICSRKRPLKIQLSPHTLLLMLIPQPEQTFLSSVAKGTFVHVYRCACLSLVRSLRTVMCSVHYMLDSVSRERARPNYGMPNQALLDAALERKGEGGPAAFRALLPATAQYSFLPSLWPSIELLLLSQPGGLVYYYRN